MARTSMTKHVIKRQEISFADWYAELREICAHRWGEISDQAPTCFVVWVGGGTPQRRRLSVPLATREMVFMSK